MKIKQVGTLLCAALFAVFFGSAPAWAAIRTATLGSGKQLEGAIVSNFPVIAASADAGDAFIGVFVDRDLAVAIAPPYVFNLNLSDFKDGAHKLSVNSYDQRGKLTGSLEFNFTLQKDFPPKGGISLGTALVPGMTSRAQVAVTSSISTADPEQQLPLVLNYLNSARSTTVEEHSLVTLDGRPSLERRLVAGDKWVLVPARNRYEKVALSPTDKDQTTLDVDSSGIPQGKLSGLGELSLGIPRLELPGRNLNIGDTWVAAMPIVYNLNPLKLQVVDAEHTLKGFAMVGNDPCALIESRYSLGGKMAVELGGKSFTFRQVAVEGTRTTCYNLTTHQPVWVTEKIQTRLSLSAAEQDSLTSERRTPIALAKLAGGPLGSAGTVVDINENQFDSAVLQNPLPTVVNFTDAAEYAESGFAQNYGPSVAQIQDRIVDALAAEMAGKASFFRIDVGRDYQNVKTLESKYSIGNIVPQVVIFRNGEMQYKSPGYGIAGTDKVLGRPAGTDELRAELQKLISAQPAAAPTAPAAAPTEQPAASGSPEDEIEAQARRRYLASRATTESKPAQPEVTPPATGPVTPPPYQKPVIRKVEPPLELVYTIDMVALIQPTAQEAVPVQ